MVDNKQQGTKVSERVQALNLQIAEQDKQKEEQKNQKKSKAKEGLYSPYMSEERKKELEDAKKHHKDTIKSAGSKYAAPRTGEAATSRTNG